MKPILVSICVLATASIAAQAASIGINLGSGRADASLVTTASAGVVPQANWNNGSGGSGSLGSLTDDTGAASGASVSWATDEQWSHGGPVDNNGILLNGWISANANPGTVDILAIPYTLYDLYIYVSHDRTNEDVLLRETNGAFADFTAIENMDSVGEPVTFVEQTTSGTGSGNYVRFQGLSAANLNLVIDRAGGGSIDRNAVSAIQVVQVPEPSTGLLALLAGLGLVARRRR